MKDFLQTKRTGAGRRPDGRLDTTCCLFLEMTPNLAAGSS